MLPPPRQPSNRDILLAIAKLATKDEVNAVRVDLKQDVARLEGHVTARLQVQDEEVASSRRDAADAKKEVLGWKTKALAAAAILGAPAVAGVTKWLKGD